MRYFTDVVLLIPLLNLNLIQQNKKFEIIRPHQRFRRGVIGSQGTSFRTITAKIDQEDAINKAIQVLQVN